MLLKIVRLFLFVCVLSGAVLRAETLYVSTNNPAGNSVLLFRPAADGTLEPLATVDAGGTGTGGNLESQSPLTISQDGRFLFAVNAASNTIASFRVLEGALEFAGTFASGGVRPTSLTERNGVLFVLNEGAGNNITGFNVGADGTLFPISGSTFPLSRENAGGAQVAFHPTQNVLIVSERFSNRLSLYDLDGFNTVLRGPRVLRSAGRFPFGFDFTDSGHVVVSEAFGGRRGGSATSSYRVSKRGRLSVVSHSVDTREIAACWVAITNDSRYAYVTNTGSNSITGYRIRNNGRLNFIGKNGTVADTGPSSAPTEAVVSADGTLLYVVYQASSRVASFTIQDDGTLAFRAVTQMPPHPIGLVSRQ